MKMIDLKCAQCGKSIKVEENRRFCFCTYCGSKIDIPNEVEIYTIKDGQLKIRASGKTSWADSRYDEEWVADDEETHRFLYKHQSELNSEGIE